MAVNQAQPWIEDDFSVNTTHELGKHTCGISGRRDLSHCPTCLARIVLVSAMLRLILRFLERRKQIYQARHNETSDASKTQPLQQWKVGREFRLRLKNALDEHQIQLGMPQQQIWHTCPTDELQHNQNSY